MATVSPVTPPPPLVGYVTEAPVDNQQYVRENAAWVVNGSGGTVTSVGTGTGLTGGPITGAGAIALDSASIASLALADTSVQAVVAGTNITVDNTNPARPVVSSTGGGGSGTVTSVSVTTANGVSGTVANPTTTPAISLTLGAITPSSVAATGTVTGSNLSGTNTGDQTNISGNAGTATALQTARTISGVSFDGTTNIVIPYSGLSGTPTTWAWSSITGTPTTLAGYGITDAQPLDGDLTAIAALAGTSGLLRKTAANTWTLDTSAYLTGNQSITLSGDVTGSGTTAITATLANSGATAGTYGDATHVGQFTVDAKGRITAASSVAISSGGTGTVTSVSVASANGFAGTVATPTSTPAITVETTVTGLLKGNGTAVSAAVSGTDYAPGTAANVTGIVKSTTGTGALTTAVAGDFPTLNQNTTGSAATLTTARNIGLSGVTATAQAFDGSANITIPVTAVPATLLTGTIAAASMPALTGDVTTTAGSVATTIAAGAVTLAKQANFAASSLMGNPTGTSAAPSAITLGAGLAFSGTTLTATASGGTVTSVAMTVPADFSVSGSPITASGTLAVTENTQSANTVKAGPSSGTAAAPTYRALVTADLPSGTTQTIASGTAALGTTAIASGAKATTVTVAATGVATTDVIDYNFNGDPTAVTGYTPSANGMLTIIAYPSAGNVNFIVANNTGASVTPGAITLNWRVLR